MAYSKLSSPVTPHVLGTLWVGVVAAGPRHPVQALVQVADVLVAEHRAVAVVDTRHLLLNKRCQGNFAVITQHSNKNLSRHGHLLSGLYLQLGCFAGGKTV